jgi:hypothetical protein
MVPFSLSTTISMLGMPSAPLARRVGKIGTSSALIGKVVRTNEIFVFKTST